MKTQKATTAGWLALAAAAGNSMYDALGSITIGLLMGGVSLFLVQKNMQLLGGQRAQREDEAVALLEADGAVRAQKNAFSQCELVRETSNLPRQARDVLKANARGNSPERDGL